ncbi:hypothetical protein Y032_0015g2840 [Ancylostoma ceylanicum]|uniref:Uncharacterized protein n=2 Tax=Ancylostoma ceylanicum TaxID=53326 RepID=A0A016V8M6_9BILA|nr:hypothetical protein Y032_0015g2840 [Ancylostoma ceylanicum]
MAAAGRRRRQALYLMYYIGLAAYFAAQLPQHGALMFETFSSYVIMGTDIILEQHKGENVGDEMACTSVDSTFLDEEDPFRSRLEVRDPADVEVLPEPPQKTRGFGLLPYLKRKRLHAGCEAQPEDFSVESLLSTPDGHGGVPVRPVLHANASSSSETSPGLAEATSSADADKRNEDVVGDELLDESLGSFLSKNEFPQVVKVECSDEPSVAPRTEHERILCVDELRAVIAAQATLFATICKRRKWEIEESSKVDVFMEKLQARMDGYTERFNQIQVFSAQHPGNIRQFIRTVFNSRPFLDVDRRRCAVDCCLNTFATYPVEKKETISRKAFNSYVSSMREKLRSKQEVIPPIQDIPPIVIPTESIPSTTDDYAMEENVPLSPSPEKIESPEKEKSPEKLPRRKLQSPIRTSTPTIRPTIAPPPLPSRRVEDRKTSSTQNASCDVLLGILNTMDHFEPTRKPTAFDPEFLSGVDDVPPLIEPSDEDVFVRDGPPMAKRIRYDDQRDEPTVSASFSPVVPSSKVASPLFININEEKATPTFTSPASTANLSGEQPKRVFDSRKLTKQLSFRDGTILSTNLSPHAAAFSSLDSIPVTKPPERVGDDRNLSNNAVKKVKVNYADDPYAYAAAKSVWTASSATERPPQIRAKLTTSESQVEDPYASFPIKRTPSEACKSEVKDTSPTASVFRSTFSSLHDRVSCSLATFDIKKSRAVVKWKLIPCSRNRRESMKSLPPGASPRDPRLASLISREQQEATNALREGESEEEIIDRTRAVLSKSYRKNPIRCVVEKSVSSIRSRIAFRGYCRRTSYPQTKLNLNAEIQFMWNKQRDRQPLEIELMELNLLPKWGSANATRALYPFGKTDGIYWPVVQPYDNVNLADERHVTCADTRNQLVCLSELTFASRRPLLCERDDGFHFKRYMQAVETDESMWQPGRFQNRVGFMRVFYTQSIEEARHRDSERQLVEAAWMKRLVEADSVNFNKTVDDRVFQRASQPNSALMSDHVDFNLSDMFSRRQEGIIRRDNSIAQPHICKGTRGPVQVPRNWFEVPIAQYMPTSQRRDYLVQYTNFRNKLTNDCRPNARESVFYNDLVQYHLSAIKAIFIHQSGYNDIGLKFVLNEQVQQKAKQRIDEINAELRGSKISLDRLMKLCELQEWEESYWTIIWENLANIYRDAPPISQLPIDRFIIKAFDAAANVPQRSAYFNRYGRLLLFRQ